jgi:hypothetical protein
MSARSFSGDDDAGPMVATILVRLKKRYLWLRSRSNKSEGPGFVVMAPLLEKL